MNKAVLKNHYFSSKLIFLFVFDIYVDWYCSSWGKIIFFCFFSVFPTWWNERPKNKSSKVFRIFVKDFNVIGG